jgi:integrase
VRITFGITDDLPSTTLMNRVGLIFLFGVETAMRASEMLGLEWERVHLKERFVHLPKTKNGDARDVPLTTFAVKILKALPKGDNGEPCFNLTESSRDALWRKGRDRTTLKNLHFHDSRAEGIWRLSKKLDVLQLARAIGHRDINSLLIYYDETASEMAAKLG